MTQLRRGVVGVVAALVLVSLSFSAQAAEKKKVMGTDNAGSSISRAVVSPGDDPKHELVMTIRRDTTTSSDPDFNGTEIMKYQQADQMAETETHRGYFRRFFKNGDTGFGSFEGSSREATWEGTWKWIGGTGKFKNSKGGGTYRGKSTAEKASTEWEGEVEY